MPPPLGYYLGLPAWAFPGWTGEYFPAPGPASSTLGHYASVFNTVEGNTTFYRIPDVPTVQRWQEAVSGTAFQFSFKLPRSITHESRPDWRALAQFMDVLAPLGNQLGPFLVQCPASLGPDALPQLERLFEQLPAQLRYVLEVRHPAFFDSPEQLEPLLARHNAGRVMFDSRPIYQGDSDHPEVLAARHKKPDVPLLDTVYNDLVYARVVLHPEAESNERFIAEWLDRMNAYLAAGHDIFFMMHCPNNQHCPAFAADFHEQLRERAGLPALPAWPLPRQDSLF
ncbi:MAG: DUF72 domain-containing protein [Halieaceae bacterium]|jgi:uncharacterized protein YecE (DUF72 family)|nr:DUF72 domain-containing protein [Halieaceae bacterium]